MLDEKSIWSAALGSALRRLIAGERGNELLAGLDIFGSSVVRRALGAISGEITLTSPAREYVDEALNAILEPNGPFIKAVIAAAQGNAEAMGAIASIFEELAADQQSSGFAATLRRIVDGERDEDLLDGLDDSTFFVVAREVLTGLTSEGDGQELRMKRSGRQWPITRPAVRYAVTGYGKTKRRYSPVRTAVAGLAVGGVVGKK